MEAALDESEVLALVTLARHVMRADGRVTDLEMRSMMTMAKEVGLRLFSDALERSNDHPALDGPELLRLARLVKRGEARLLMFRLLAELANSDGIATPEKQLLDALAAEWRIDWEAT